MKGFNVRALASVDAGVSLTGPSDVPAALAAGQPPVAAALDDAHVKDVQEQLLATLRGPTAKLRPPEVLPRAPNACAAAAGVPKVALLFLTDGALPHARTWEAWLCGAAGVLPAEAPGCGVAACAAPSPLQHLFTLYLHLPPAANTSSLSPLWSAALTGRRVAQEWGSRSTLAATRYLLEEAFRDPSNQRFVLLSSAHVPLWHPLVTWRQMTGEQRSRVEARRRPDAETDAWRWVSRMAEPPHAFPRAHWRKSSRWFVLTRPHARAVLADSAVYRTFEAHCNSGWDEAWGAWRECPAEEHYVPSLLAAAGREGETVAAGEPGAGVFEDWSGGRAAPREFLTGDVTAAAFLEGIGGCPGVQRRQLVETVRRQFVQKGCEGAATGAAAAPPPPLNASCFFAAAGRFGPGTAQPVLAAACDPRLAAIDCGAAGGARER